MKKRLFAALAAFLLLTGCACQDGLSQVSRELGVDVTGAAAVEYYDTHGGFHGDGTTCITCRFDDDTVLEEIRSSSEWRAFPLDDTARALVYGLSDETTRIGPMLNDNEGHPIVPVIRHGYYRLIDRQKGAEGALLERYSFNLTLGLYDADTNTLYFCKLDT